MLPTPADLTRRRVLLNTGVRCVVFLIVLYAVANALVVAHNVLWTTTNTPVGDMAFGTGGVTAKAQYLNELVAFAVNCLGVLAVAFLIMRMQHSIVRWLSPMPATTCPSCSSPIFGEQREGCPACGARLNASGSSTTPAI